MLLAIPVQLTRGSWCVDQQRARVDSLIRSLELSPVGYSDLSTDKVHPSVAQDSWKTIKGKQLVRSKISAIFKRVETL